MRYVFRNDSVTYEDRTQPYLFFLSWMGGVVCDATFTSIPVVNRQSFGPSRGTFQVAASDPIDVS